MIREMVITVLAWFAVLIVSGVLYFAILNPIITRREPTDHGKAMLSVLSFAISAVLGVFTACGAMWLP